jgi:hypothetical protein
MALSVIVLNELTHTNDFFRVFVQLAFQILLFLFVSTFSRVAEERYEIDTFCFFFLEHGVEFCFCVRIITLVLDLNLVICIVWDDIWIGRLSAGGFGFNVYPRHLFSCLLDAFVWACQCYLFDSSRGA